MHDVLSGYVERGEVPGYVALVSRGDEVHVECSGYARDTIFRIASMTKPITAAAALILVEHSVLPLDDPIDDLLPELAELKVLRAIDAAIEDTVPAKRKITPRDLLIFTLGTGLVYAMPGTYPIQEAISKAGLHVDSPRKPAAREWLERMTSLPLVLQPGEGWMYNAGSDVLGILIARVARRSFGDFLHERIFEPLGMNDTAFYVPAGSVSRLPVGYMPVANGGFRVEDMAGAESVFSHPPALESGAGGLVSTVDDFLAFARMLLRDGTPILSAGTVQAMTADQLTRAQKARALWTPGYFETHGWGFGVAVDLAEHPGQYGWDGGFGTTWRSDPREDLIAILMTQVGMISPAGPQIFRDFYTLAYSALE